MVRGRRRYATIGNANAMTIPEARRAARRLIASYIEPAKNADSLKTPGRPMTAFVEEFWRHKMIMDRYRIAALSPVESIGYFQPEAGCQSVDAPIAPVLVVIIKRLSLCQVAEISHFRVNARDRSV